MPDSDSGPRPLHRGVAVAALAAAALFPVPAAHSVQGMRLQAQVQPCDVPFWAGTELSWTPEQLMPDETVVFTLEFANSRQEGQYDRFEGQFFAKVNGQNVATFGPRRGNTAQARGRAPENLKPGARARVTADHGEFEVICETAGVAAAEPPAPVSVIVNVKVMSGDATTQRTIGPLDCPVGKPCKASLDLAADECGGSACDLSTRVTCTTADTCSGLVTAAPCGTTDSCSDDVDFECERLRCIGAAGLEIPLAAAGFPWWIIVVAAVALIAIGIFIWRSRVEEEEVKLTVPQEEPKEGVEPCRGKHKIRKTFGPLVVCERPGERLGTQAMDLLRAEAELYAYEFCRKLRCPPGGMCTPVIVEENIGGGVTVDAPCPDGMQAWEYTYTLGIVECMCLPRPDISPADLDRKTREEFERTMNELRSKLRIIEP